MTLICNGDDSETLTEDTYKNKEECKNEQPSEGSAENSKKDESDIEHDVLDTMVKDTYQDKEERKKELPQISGNSNKYKPKNVKELFSKNTDGSFSCNVCPKISQKRQIMREHTETHSSGLDHQCKSCVKVFRTKGALRQHKHRSHRMSIKIQNVSS